MLSYLLIYTNVIRRTGRSPLLPIDESFLISFMIQEQVYNLKLCGRDGKIWLLIMHVVQLLRTRQNCPLPSAALFQNQGTLKKLFTIFTMIPQLFTLTIYPNKRDQDYHNASDVFFYDYKTLCPWFFPPFLSLFIYWAKNIAA